MVRAFIFRDEPHAADGHCALTAAGFHRICWHGQVITVHADPHQADKVDAIIEKVGGIGFWVWEDKGMGGGLPFRCDSDRCLRAP
jgi:hypothetical protein